jgi:hypothetical protein
VLYASDVPLAHAVVLKEFRRHRDITNPVHIMGFLTQWKMYLDELPRDPSDSRSFKKLDPTVYEKVFMILLIYGFGLLVFTCVQMSAEQLGQLYEFMHATKEIWKPVNGEQT